MNHILKQASKRILSLLLFSILLGLYGCAPRLDVVWQKPEFKGDKFNKLVIVAITDNLENRNVFEETAVKLLKMKGIKALRGVDYFPPNLDPKLHSKESLRKIVIDNKIDGVITISLIDKEEISQYVQGSTYVTPTYYDPYGYYMYERYTTVQTPGYYINSKKYVIEGVLHDLNLGMSKEDRLVWRGQSSLIDPSSVRAAAVDFNKAMVNYMVKEGLLVK